MIKKLPKETKVPNKSHKKNNKNRRNSKKNNKNLIIIVLSVLVVLFAFIGIYLTVNNNTLEDKTEKLQTQIAKLKKIQKDFIQEQENQVAKYFEEKTKDLEIEYSKPIDNLQYIQNSKKEEQKIKFIYDDEPLKKEEYKEVLSKDQKIKSKEPNQIKSVKQQLPKLAIIIDDVTNSRQIKAIQNIGYDVNMAFLPPTPRHQNSAKITKDLKNYMIHLPLQATSNKYDEQNTLYVSDSIERIERRIKVLSQLYPKAKFINNHTGSRFTANTEAMDKLFSVLKKYDYTFIDSKTTAKSVAKQSAQKYGIRVLSRNIFLDNKKDKQYIQNQLKKAIKIAKKYGSAIAIGHPYSVTFEALQDSKIYLEGIETVFVDKL